MVDIAVLIASISDLGMGETMILRASVHHDCLLESRNSLFSFVLPTDDANCCINNLRLLEMTMF